MLLDHDVLIECALEDLWDRRVAFWAAAISMTVLVCVGAGLVAAVNLLGGWVPTVFFFLALVKVAEKLQDIRAAVWTYIGYKHMVPLREWTREEEALAFCRENHLVFWIEPEKERLWPIFTFRHEKDAVVFKLMFG